MWRLLINKTKFGLLRLLALVVASNLILSFCVLLSLGAHKIDVPFLIKPSAESHEIDPALDRQQPLGNNATPGFIFYDLPLPGWAKGFRIPIDGAEIPQNANLLPGAARSYRNGRHEGVDIYCAYGTPVLASKDGYILSVGADYHDLPKVLRDRLLAIAKNLFSTPSEVTDALHGRRVLLDHGISDGRWVVTVYSHLSDVEKNLTPGTFVKQGHVIGRVGNSGTSKAGTTYDSHLHFEIRVNDHNLGEGMSPKEAGKLYAAIINGEIK